MAEENCIGGSQESLPLSQESYMQLLTQLSQNHLPNFINDGTAADIPVAVQEFPSMVAAMDIPVAQEFPSMVNGMTINPDMYLAEQIGASCSTIQVPNQFPQCSSTEQKYAPCSLPASVTWPGEHFFNVTFSSQENVKGVSWIFSKLKNKLFVGKDVSCPVNFSTANLMTDDVSIRAMALFSSSDHASEVVHRCVNHSMDEYSKGVFEAEHIIRCESSMARYEKNELTGRHSVVVPFENPPAGQCFSSYIYKFACFTSCSGGPNRRPLLLIFSLEKGNQVIGRHKIDLKICACPGRDMRSEEKQMHPVQDDKVPIKRKEPVIPLALTPDSCSSKKMKLSPKNSGPYTIKVNDRECYDFLKNMKRYFKIYSVMKSQYASELKLFVYSSLSSDEDNNTEQ